jgi:peptide/nickel transport system permease protein
MSFILRRIGFYLLAAWASLTLNFFLPRMMPGDPGDAIMARMQGRLTTRCGKPMVSPTIP